MKCIIAGSRTITDSVILQAALNASGFQDEITEVVWGGADGVDTLGWEWSCEQRLSAKRFPANWSKHGRVAGPIRNREMAEYADALLLVWDGESRGSANMLKEATARHLRVFVYRTDLHGKDSP